MLCLSLNYYEKNSSLPKGSITLSEISMSPKTDFQIVNSIPIFSLLTTVGLCKYTNVLEVNLTNQ